MKEALLWKFLALVALVLCGHLWLQNDTLRGQNAALRKQISGEQASDQQFQESLDRGFDQLLQQLGHIKAVVDAAEDPQK